MDDLWITAVDQWAIVARARAAAVDPDRHGLTYVRALMSRLDRDVIEALAARGLYFDGAAYRCGFHDDADAFTAALAEAKAVAALAATLRAPVPDTVPDTWPDRPPPPPGGADHLREDTIMTVLNKTTTATAGDEPAGADLTVPEHLRDAYARTGGRAYWHTIEVERRLWHERTPEHAQSPEAWAAEEHRWRLAEAENIVRVEKESAERTAAYDAARRCYCCGDEYRDSIHDDIGPRCRAVLHAQQATEYSTAVLSSGTRRADAVTTYRTARGK